MCWNLAYFESILPFSYASHVPRLQWVWNSKDRFATNLWSTLLKKDSFANEKTICYHELHFFLHDNVGLSVIHM